MPVRGSTKTSGKRALLLGHTVGSDSNDEEDITVTVHRPGDVSPTGHHTSTSTFTTTTSTSSSSCSTPPRDFNKNHMHMNNNNNNNNYNNNKNNNNNNNSGDKTRSSTGTAAGPIRKALTTTLFVRTKTKPKSKVYTTKFTASAWPGCIIRRKHFVGILALAMLLLYINYMIVGDDRSEDKVPVTHYSHVPGMKGYLVWSDRCKMPNMDPYLPEVMQHFKRQKHKSCSSTPPLTRVTFNASTQLYTLQVNEYSIHDYSKSGLTDCCYQRILRNANGTHADKDIKFAECVRFKHSVVLPTAVDNIIVKCFYKKKQVYLHGHAMMPARPDIRERLAHWRDTTKATEAAERPPSVLLIGIDSISRNNLIRAMPKTAQYLYDNEWFEMSGYNKIDDNTFPNLMAILTGLNYTTAVHRCPPTRTNGLAHCTFIWDLFRQHGYVTAYGEDEASINTFNYGKLGFEHPPVDYYLRPFLLGAEKTMHIQRKSGLSYCLGQLHSADFVYDYAVELATRYRDEPFFGLFWTNTFSHNAISDPSSMDERILYYLKTFATLGTLNNTIVVFFSDHGIRFGPTRRTLSGHLEERLPFMFLWLPPTIKTANPEFVNALSVNKNRLTNPYDLHMTLKMVLLLSGRSANRSAQLEQAPQGCSRCQTLLRPVPHNRSCADIAIEDHWCTCIPYQSVYKNSKKVQKLARRIVDHMNDYVATYRNGSVADKCVQLMFSSVDNAYRAQMFMTEDAAGTGVIGADTLETYRILLYTKPNNGLFEATVRYTEATDALEVTGEISRLNMYSSDSSCVEDGGAKKYCSCRRKLF